MNGDDKQYTKNLIEFWEDHLSIQEQEALAELLKTEDPSTSSSIQEIHQRGLDRFGKIRAGAQEFENIKDPKTQLDWAREAISSGEAASLTPKHFSNMQGYDRLRGAAGSVLKQRTEEGRRAQVLLDWNAAIKSVSAKAANLPLNVVTSIFGHEMGLGLKREEFEAVRAHRARSGGAAIAKGFGEGATGLMEMLPGLAVTTGVGAATKFPGLVSKITKGGRKVAALRAAGETGKKVAPTILEKSTAAFMGGAGLEGTKQLLSKGLGTEYMRGRGIDPAEAALHGGLLAGASGMKGVMGKVLPKGKTLPGKAALKFVEETPVAGAFAGMEYAQSGDLPAALGAFGAYQAIGGFPEKMIPKINVKKVKAIDTKKPYRSPLVDEVMDAPPTLVEAAKELVPIIGRNLTAEIAIPESIRFVQEPDVPGDVTKGAGKIINKIFGGKYSPEASQKALETKKSTLLNALDKVKGTESRDEIKALLHAVDTKIGSEALRTLEAREGLEKGEGNYPESWAATDSVKRMMDGPAGMWYQRGLKWFTEGQTTYHGIKELYKGSDVNKKLMFSPTKLIGNPERTATSTSTRLKAIAELSSRAEYAQVLITFIKKHKLHKFPLKARQAMPRYLSGLRTDSKRVSGTKLRERGTPEKMKAFFDAAVKKYGKGWGECVLDMRLLLDNHRARKAKESGKEIPEEYGINDYYPKIHGWDVQGEKALGLREMLKKFKTAGIKMSPYSDLAAAKRYFSDKSMLPRLSKDPRYNLDPIVWLTEHLPSTISYLNHAPVEQRIKDPIYGKYRRLRVRKSNEKQDMESAIAKITRIRAGSPTSNREEAPSHIISINGKDFYRFVGTEKFVNKNVNIYEGSFNKKGNLIEVGREEPRERKLKLKDERLPDDDKYMNDIGIATGDVPKEKKNILEQIARNEGRVAANAVEQLLKYGVEPFETHQFADGTIIIGVEYLSKQNIKNLNSQNKISVKSRGKLGGHDIILETSKPYAKKLRRAEIKESWKSPRRTKELYVRRSGDPDAPIYRIPLTRDNVNRLSVRQGGLFDIIWKPNMREEADRWFKKNMGKEDIRNLQDSEKMMLKFMDAWVGYSYFTTLAEFNTKTPITNFLGGQASNFRTLGGKWFTQGWRGFSIPGWGKKNYPDIHKMIHEKLKIGHSGKKWDLDRLNPEMGEKFVPDNVKKALHQWPKWIRDISYINMTATEYANRIPCAWGAAIRAVDGYGFRYDKKRSLQQNIEVAHKVGIHYGNGDLVRKMNPKGDPKKQRKIVDEIFRDAVEQEVIGAVQIAQNLYGAMSPQLWAAPEWRWATMLTQWTGRYVDRFFYEDMKELFQGKPGKFIRNTLALGFLYEMGHQFGMDWSTVVGENTGEFWPISQMSAFQEGKPLEGVAKIPTFLQMPYGASPAAQIASAVFTGANSHMNGANWAQMWDDVRNKHGDSIAGLIAGRELKIWYDYFRKDESGDPEKPERLFYAFSDTPKMDSKKADLWKYMIFPGVPKPWKTQYRLQAATRMEGYAVMYDRIRRQMFEYWEKKDFKSLKAMEDATGLKLENSDIRRFQKQESYSAQVRKFKPLHPREKVKYMERGWKKKSISVHEMRIMIAMLKRSTRIGELQQEHWMTLDKLEQELKSREKSK